MRFLRWMGWEFMDVYYSYHDRQSRLSGLRQYLETISLSAGPDFASRGLALQYILFRVLIFPLGQNPALISALQIHELLPFGCRMRFDGAAGSATNQSREQ